MDIKLHFVLKSVFLTFKKKKVNLFVCLLFVNISLFYQTKAVFFFLVKITEQEVGLRQSAIVLVHPPVVVSVVSSSSSVLKMNDPKWLIGR